MLPENLTDLTISREKPEKGVKLILALHGMVYYQSRLARISQSHEYLQARKKKTIFLNAMLQGV